MVFLHLGKDIVPSLRVKTGGGLVQHKDAGLHGHDAGHRHPALLTAGQFKGAALQKRRVQAHKVCGFVDAAVYLGLVQPHVLGAKGDVLVAVLLKQLVFRVLEHKPGEEAEIPDLFRVCPQVAAVDINFAAGGLVQAVHVGDEGAFAGAGGPDDAHKIALFYGKAHVVQRGHCGGQAGVIDVAQMFYLNDICHFVRPPYCSSSYSACAQAPVSMMPSGIGMPAFTSSSRSSAACGTSKCRLRTFSVWLNTSFGVPSITT